MDPYSPLIAADICWDAGSRNPMGLHTLIVMNSCSPLYTKCYLGSISTLFGL